MIIIEYVFLGLYGMIIGIDKLFSVLFGPGRFLVYAFIVFMLALPVIKKTVTWNQYRDLVNGFASWLTCKRYGLTMDELELIQDYYKPSVSIAIETRDYKTAKLLKRLYNRGKYKDLLVIIKQYLYID